MKCVNVQLFAFYNSSGVFAHISMFIHEGLDGGSWYSLITKDLAIYSLSLKFWLIH